MTVTEIIAQDEELSKLLIRVFKWRPPHIKNDILYCATCAHAVRDLADKLYEKYDIEMEIYT